MHPMEMTFFSSILRLIFLVYFVTLLPSSHSLEAEFHDGVPLVLRNESAPEPKNLSTSPVNSQNSCERKGRSLRVKVRRISTLQKGKETWSASSEPNAPIYVNFPDEGPEAALLADFLSRMAVRTLFEPLFRLTVSTEAADILTMSMYSTALIIGTFVFGIGFLVLSWKVYLSIKTESADESIPLIFLLTIPGLRYLSNHYRHHLWGCNLMPRRRFASFMVRGSKSTASDLFLNDVSEMTKRKDTISRSSEVPSSASTNRRKSLAKPSVKKDKEYAVEVEGEKSSKKRHSVVILTPPSSLNPSFISTPVPSITTTTFTEEFKEQAQLPNINTKVDIDVAPEVDINVPEVVSIHSPIPQMSPILFAKIEEEEEVEVDINELSEETITTLTTQESVINDSEEDSLNESTEHLDVHLEERSASPVSEVSATSTETIDSTNASTISNEVLEKRRTEWVRNMPLFSRDASPLSYDLSQNTSVYPIKESKLSRRLQEGKDKNHSPDESKLSRYFKASREDLCSPIQSPFNHSSNTVISQVEIQLEEGTDLTPPPGFNRRHSSFLPPPSNSSNNQADNEEEGDDLIDPQFSFRLRSNTSSRRQSFIHSQNDWKWFIDDSTSTLPDLPGSVPFNSSQSTTTSVPSNLKISHQLVDENIPSRPNSANQQYSGRASLQHSYPNEQLSNETVPSTDRSPSISLGIFDDIFPPQKDRRSPSLYFQ